MTELSNLCGLAQVRAVKKSCHAALVFSQDRPRKRKKQEAQKGDGECSETAPGETRGQPRQALPQGVQIVHPLEDSPLTWKASTTVNFVSPVRRGLFFATSEPGLPSLHDARARHGFLLRPCRRLSLELPPHLAAHCNGSLVACFGLVNFIVAIHGTKALALCGDFSC